MRLFAAPLFSPASPQASSSWPRFPGFGVVGPRFWSRAIADSVFVEIELAGRVWSYRNLGFGRETAVYGPALVAAADSGRFDARIGTIRKAVAEETDSAKTPTGFEAEVATGRLIQSGKLRDRPADARRAFGEALTVDPSNTTAGAWRWVVESSAPGEPP